MWDRMSTSLASKSDLKNNYYHPTRSRSRSPYESRRRNHRSDRRECRSRSPRRHQRYSRSRSRYRSSSSHLKNDRRRRSDSYFRRRRSWGSRSIVAQSSTRRHKQEVNESPLSIPFKSRDRRRSYSPRRGSRASGRSYSNHHNSIRKRDRERQQPKYRDDRNHLPNYHDDHPRGLDQGRSRPDYNFQRERERFYGVVSDDEERDKYKVLKKKTRHHGRSSRESKRKMKSSTYSDRSSSSRDDSYGHFEGRKGCIIGERYKILKDLGKGTFGRVVQAIDLDHQHDRRNDGTNLREKRHKSSTKLEDSVAIKIVRRVKRYHKSALIEADILKDVNSRGGRGKSLCAILLNQFEFDGHCCLVFECLGRSLYDFMKTHGHKPFPLYCVIDFAKQLLDALDFIHSFGLIHTDLKPENILLLSNRERSHRNPDGSDQQVPASTCIKLIDFGGATYDTERRTSVINTRQYRSPEVILELGWGKPSDMWSTGCILAELYKGDLLFATHDNSEHLALMERIIGQFPKEMLSKSNSFGRLFDSYGFHSLDLPSESKDFVRKTKSLENILKLNDQSAGLIELLRDLLKIDPVLRVTAKEALKSSIFVQS